MGWPGSILRVDEPVEPDEAEVVRVAAAPAERLVLDGGIEVVRSRPEHAAASVEAINASLDHLAPWMVWAEAPAELEATQRRLTEAIAAWDDRRDFTFTVIDTDGGRVLGGTGLHLRLGRTGLEIGYWVRADAAGRGLATEVARALTTAALAVPEVVRVRISCEVANVRSARVPEKLGYRYLGEFGGDGGRRMQRWEVEGADWDR